MICMCGLHVQSYSSGAAARLFALQGVNRPTRGALNHV